MSEPERDIVTRDDLDRFDDLERLAAALSEKLAAIPAPDVVLARG